MFDLNPSFIEEMDRRMAEESREKTSVFVGYVAAIDADGKRAKIERSATETTDRPPYPILGGNATAAGISVGSYAWCLGTFSGALLVLGKAVA